MLSIGSYAKVWKIDKKDNGIMIAQVSTSTKNKDGNYETDFSDFIVLCGDAKNLEVNTGDTLIIDKFSVGNDFDKEKNVKNYRFLVSQARVALSRNTIPSSLEAAVENLDESML